MKKLRFLGVIAALIATFAVATAAFAYGPTMTTYPSGNGTTVTISGGQPNSSVVITYTPSGSNLSSTITGTTDYSGSFTTMVQGSQIQATVGGQAVYAGNNNNYYNGCGYYGCNSGSLSLSQTNVSVPVGQTVYITVNNNYYGNLYISGNTNSSAATASISNGTITIYGNTQGYSTLTICAGGNGSCATAYVTVTGSVLGANTNISVSPSSVSLNVNDTRTVNVAGVSGSDVTYGRVNITANSDSNVASAYLSSDYTGQVVVNILARQAGSTTLTICSNYSSNCTYVYVTVGYSSAGSLTFSQNSLTISAGQTTTVSAYNNFSYTNLFVSGNTYPSVASASVSGNTIYINGLNSGSTTITICTNGSSQCGLLYVTVYGSSSGSTILLSPSSLNLGISQTSNVTISGPYTYPYYISNNSAPTIASAVISNNILTVTGSNTGYTTLTVCQTGVSQCASLGVTVNNAGFGNLSLSQSSVSLGVSQNATVTANNNGNTVYVSGNSNPGVVTTSASGNQVILHGAAVGSSNVTVCTLNVSQCATVYVTVTAGLSYPGGSVQGAAMYPNGTLVSDNGTVYIIYKNTKSGFASAAVFKAFGFSFDNVISASTAGLLDTGYVISNGSAAHPWGSWIKSGSTIYFVHESGLIPVPDWNTFINNGGQSNLVVSANHADFSLPRLSVMTISDPRLQ